MRNRDARRSQAHQARVEGGAAIVGGKKPERNADKNREVIAEKASASVFGRRCRIRSSTGCWPLTVVPRSPCRRRPTKRTYCSGIGRSRPRRSADLVELLGRGALALRVHDAHRVAGHEVDQQASRRSWSRKS